MLPLDLLCVAFAGAMHVGIQMPGVSPPSWVATRRGLHKPVSSSPPLKTVRTTFMVYGLAPGVPLRDARSVPSHFASSSGVHPWTACAFAGYLWSGLSAG